MAIASRQWEAIGSRIYVPEGPFGLVGTTSALNGPTFNYGDVVDGNCESEFIYLKFSPVSSVTYNEGDVFVWDSSLMAVPAKLGAAYHSLGSHVGTLFFGGREGDPASNLKGQGNIWSYTFAPGTYGIWLQRAGRSVVNFTTITAQADPASTTATLGSVSALASAPSNSATINGLYSAVQSFTFTATDAVGSSQLTAVSDTNKLEIGMLLSGTGIPSATYITDIQGPTVYMSNQATSANSGTTVTAKKGTFYGVTVNGSPLITVTGPPMGGILGVFPNATLTGTGVARFNRVWISAIGNVYTITLSANCTATNASPGTSIAATQYVEGFLSWPWINGPELSLKGRRFSPPPHPNQSERPATPRAHLQG